MTHRAKSLSAHEEDAKRVSRSVMIETVAVVLFLVGALLVLAAFVNTTAYWVELIAPEQAIPPEGWMKGVKVGPWEVVLGFLPFVLPASFLMSAGLVLRRFIAKD
jgi:hypothetical protein